MEAKKYAELKSEIWDIPGELLESCEHLPNQLTQIDEYYDGTTITKIFNCECGELVEDVFQLITTQAKRGM